MGQKELLYGLLQSLSILAFANADFIGKSLDNCVSFDMKRIQEYISTLDTPDFPSNFPHHQEEEMEENLRPFGVIKNDWMRLNLLRDSLPENSELRTKFDNIFRLLLVAHDRAKKFSRSLESEESRDNLTTKTTLSPFKAETDVSKQEIYETSPVTVTEEFLSLNEPHEKVRENLKILSVNSTNGNVTDETNDAITNSSTSLLKSLANFTNLSIEKGSNEAMVENTSQRPNYNDEEKALSQPNCETTVENTSHQSNYSDEEKTTSQPNGETTLVESSTVFQGLSSILGLNGPILHQFAKMPVSVSTTTSDDENDSSLSHRNFISFPDELISTAASILPPKSTDEESEFLSNDFTSSTESIFDDKMEKVKSISDFFEVSEVSDQSLSTTPREKESTSIKMEDQRTMSTLSLIIKTPLEILTKTNFSESSSNEIDSAKTILDTQNDVSSLPSSMPTNSIKQTMILEESSTMFGDSTTRRLSLMNTPHDEVLLLRNQEINGTSSRQFSSSEEYSSTAEVKDTRVERTTIPSEEIVFSKEQGIDNKSWSQSSTPEEYSSTAKLTNTPNTERLTTIPSEEISLSEEQSIDNKSWTEFLSSEEYSSTAKLTDTPNTEILTTREEILISENQEIYNSSWTKFPYPEEYSWSTELTNATATRTESSFTDSIEESILQNQEIHRKFCEPISEPDEKEQPTITIDHSSTENQSLKTTPIEEPLLTAQTLKERTEEASTFSSKEDLTQSSLNADFVTELIKMDMKKSSMINSNDELTTSIDPTVKSNEIKTIQDEEEHISSNSQSLSQTFTSDPTIVITERKCIDCTENPESQEKILTENSSAKYSTKSDQSEEKISTRVSFDEASKKMITEATEFSKEWQNPNTTEKSRKKLENENLKTNAQRNETENLKEDNEKPLDSSGKWTKSNFVKNPLHNSRSVNNHIFHYYKHASDDSALEDDDSESPRIILYESGVGAINRSVWMPQIDKRPPTGNRIWHLGNFNKNVESNGHEEDSRSTQTNIDIPKKSINNSEWPFSARKNTLRSRKRGSANADIEKQFRWFYRQAGQSDHVGSRDNEKDDAQINVRC